MTDYDKSRVVENETDNGYESDWIITVDGETVFHYSDASNDSPEDFIWNRDISGIFYAGVKAGLLLSSPPK